MSDTGVEASWRAAPPYTDDVPAQTPLFSYDRIAAGLARALTRISDGAVVVGIHGPWGSGKSTLMGAVKRAIEAEPDGDATIFVEFNAWKYRESEALWRALILHVIASLRGHDLSDASFEELEDALYRTVTVHEAGPWKVDWRSLIVEIASIGLAVVRLDFVANWLRGSSKALARIFGRNKDSSAGALDRTNIERLGSVIERTAVERQIARVQSIEQFLARFRELMQTATSHGYRVCVLIDDLDRCVPDAALEVFEAVKLFLDAPGCSFVVALDRDVIRKGLALRYPTTDHGELVVNPDLYIEKTISISYDLPALSGAQDLRTLIPAAAIPFELNDKETELLEAGLGTSPRRWKRFFNLFVLHQDLAEFGVGAPEASLWTNLPADERALHLKLLLLSYGYSGVFSAGGEDPGLLERLQGIANQYAAQSKREPEAARKVRGRAIEEERAVVRQLRLDERFWNLLAAAPQLNAENAKSVIMSLRSAAGSGREP